MLEGPRLAPRQLEENVSHLLGLCDLLHARRLVGQILRLGDARRFGVGGVRRDLNGRAAHSASAQSIGMDRKKRGGRAPGQNDTIVQGDEDILLARQDHPLLAPRLDLRLQRLGEVEDDHTPSSMSPWRL